MKAFFTIFAILFAVCSCGGEDGPVSCRVVSYAWPNTSECVLHVECDGLKAVVRPVGASGASCTFEGHGYECYTGITPCLAASDNPGNNIKLVNFTCNGCQR